MTLADDIKVEPDCPKPGSYRRVPFGDYVRWDAVNFSKLKPGRQSALQMKYEMHNTREPSSSMKIGSALDCLVFDGQEYFDSLYMTAPKFPGDPRSKIHKDAKAAWEAEHQNSAQLTHDESQDVRGMYNALRNHALAWPLLTGGKGKSQLSIVWRDEKTGRLCKGRIDRLAEVDSVIIDSKAAVGQKTLVLIDLKTTKSPGIEPIQFPKEVVNFAYHGQLGYYETGCKTLSPGELLPLIVAVQNAPPYDVVVHRLDGDAGDGRTVIEHGRALARRLLDTYDYSVKHDFWPGQCSVINPISLPGYAREADVEESEES